MASEGSFANNDDVRELTIFLISAMTKNGKSVLVAIKAHRIVRRRGSHVF
jgi:hypothetical protein